MSRSIPVMHSAGVLATPTLTIRLCTSARSHSFTSSARQLHVKSTLQTSRAWQNATGVITQWQRRGISIAALDADRGDRERIVILGSGWSGYPLATALSPTKYQVLVVSPRSYFVFTPLLAEAACGTIELRTTVEPVRGRSHTHIKYVQAWADEVDFVGKRLVVEEAVADPRQGLALTAGDGKKAGKEGKGDEEVGREREAMRKKGQVFELGYDKLVISVGCYLQTFGTPGVKEHAYFLKDVGDARKIRTRLLECFELAELPTVTEERRKQLLTFCIIGGGPTGIEFSATLHDLIFQDLKHLYPDVIKSVRIIVYDVSPKILSMFEAKLGEYAQQTLSKENIEIRTSRKIVGIERGFPGSGDDGVDLKSGLTLRVEGEPDLGVGMCVWSTGLAQNPFIEKSLQKLRDLPHDGSIAIHATEKKGPDSTEWTICQDKKTGSILTDHQLRVMLEPRQTQQSDGKVGTSGSQAVLRDVFAMGDCAVMHDTTYPATAQVASQKAYWLAKRLNKGDLEQSRFEFKNLGTMAYLGSSSGIVQGGKGFGNLQGRLAWLAWKGVYLTKTLSWRNKILLPIYWLTNWMFGKDISRF